MIYFKTKILARLCVISALAWRGFAGDSLEEVYRAPQAEYLERMTKASSHDILRMIQVRHPLSRDESRMQPSVVRIPLFFHKGELRSLDELKLTGEEGIEVSIPMQFDNLRLGEDGGVARCDLYLELRPTDGQDFELRLQEGKEGERVKGLHPCLTVVEDGAIVLVKGELRVAFYGEGASRGRLKFVEKKGKRIRFERSGAGPRALLQEQDESGLKLANAAFDSKDVEDLTDLVWAGGEIFGKLRARYRIPKLDAILEY